MGICKLPWLVVAIALLDQWTYGMSASGQVGILTRFHTHNG